MEICEKSLCTGCGACQNICIKSCISIDLDEEGFYKYNVNSKLCVNCGLCIKICPSNGYVDVVKKIQPIPYLCWNIDADIRVQSSSGGLFTLFANKVIESKGIVFGVVFDNELDIKHVGVTNRKDLEKLRGSKYTQSNTGLTFNEVKRALECGRMVLYTGTPCQIAGLYSFLGNDYLNLITCDCICHGVFSTNLYRDIINSYEVKYKSKIVDIKYRDKKYGWEKSCVKITFKSGKIIYNNKYTSILTYGFAAGFTNNKTCGQCIHSTIPRRADITLGDYGGNDYNIYSKENRKKGISLLIINSKKGKDIFDLIKTKMYYEEKLLDDLLVSQKNISTSNKIHPNREKFFEDYLNLGFTYIKKHYLKAPLKNKLIHKFGVKRYMFIREKIKKYSYFVLRKRNDK